MKTTALAVAVAMATAVSALAQTGSESTFKKWALTPPMG